MKWTCDCDNPASAELSSSLLLGGFPRPDVTCTGCGKLIGRLIIRELTLVRCISMLDPDSVHLGTHEQQTLCGTTLYNRPAEGAAKVTCELCLKLAKLARALPASVL